MAPDKEMEIKDPSIHPFRISLEEEDGKEGHMLA
jgi:hypothetical protein